MFLFWMKFCIRFWLGFRIWMPLGLELMYISSEVLDEVELIMEVD